jgi:hypothetical protein
LKFQSQVIILSWFCAWIICLSNEFALRKLSFI